MPVHVWEGDATRRTLTDVESAAVFLLDQWPDGKDGALHRAARVAALAVLDGRVPPDDFRRAFVLAAAHAEILAEAEPLPLPKKLPAHVARPWDFRKAGKGARATRRRN